MIYQNIVEATLLKRLNRFEAEVNINDHIEIVHVKNTGRCTNLFVDHPKVLLTKIDNPNRKTAYDLIAVQHPKLGLVNIDSQAPNKVTLDYLKGLNYFDKIVPEFTFGKSRIDFYMQKDQRKFLFEIKGCTLEINGEGYFPDAPTGRGTKHIYELIEAKKQGFEVSLGFVIQMNKIIKVNPHSKIDAKFAEAFSLAKQEGVKILFLTSVVTHNELRIDVKKNLFI